MLNFLDPIEKQVEEVKKINISIKEIDSRIYLFEGYKPKPHLTYFSDMDKFWLIILNAYSLLYDCDKIMKALCLNLRQLNHRHLNPTCDSCLKYINYIKNVRTYLCHNNRYFYDSVYSLDWERQIGNAIGKSLREFVGSDWTFLLEKTVKLSNQFFNDLDTLIKAIKKTPSTYNKVIFNSFINAMMENFEKKVIEVMAQLYQIKEYAPPKNVFRLKKWIVDKVKIKFKDTLNDDEIYTTFVDTTKDEFYKKINDCKITFLSHELIFNIIMNLYFTP